MSWISYTSARLTLDIFGLARAPRYLILFAVVSVPGVYRVLLFGWIMLLPVSSCPHQCLSHVLDIHPALRCYQCVSTGGRQGTVPCKQLDSPFYLQDPDGDLLMTVRTRHVSASNIAAKYKRFTSQDHFRGIALCLSYAAVCTLS